MTNAVPEPDHADETSLFALLEHFRRCGMQFLPAPDRDRVQQLISQMNAPAFANSGVSTEADKPLSATASGEAASPKPAALSPPRSRLAPVPVAHPTGVAQLQPCPGPRLPVIERAAMLGAIADEVASCTRCDVLAKSRKHTVPGEGNPAARVCFLGEAPGAEEDASGQPFVGRAGQLLTKMIQACTFSREDVFILNTIKCRPPGNRNPAHDEVEHCREYLQRQLDIIQPEYIVCLGLVAAQTLLRSKLSIGRLRNQFHAYRGSKVLVTYHPSYLLREPEVKKAAWADLQFLLRDMGIELPKK
jgi:uracil-DNA glycosylase